MPRPTVLDGEFIEGIPFLIQARPVDKNQVVQGSDTLTTSGADAYTLNVYDITHGGSPTLVHTEDGTASNVTFQASTSPSTTNGWDKDDTGWTIQLAVDPAAFSVTNAEGEKNYKFELTLEQAATSEAIPVDHRMACLGRAGS